MDLNQTARLLAEALEGKDDARAELLERLRPRIVLWAGTRMSPALRAKVEPEDVAQEVLLAVHKALDRFEVRDQRAFLAWVFRIAENRIRDLVDYHGAVKRKLPQPVSFSQTSPSSVAGAKERVTHLLAALDDLPPDYQEVIRLRRLQELECREVARIMERSENAVRVLYCRALKALGHLVRDRENVKDGDTSSRSRG